MCERNLRGIKSNFCGKHAYATFSLRENVLAASFSGKIFQKLETLDKIKNLSVATRWEFQDNLAETSNPSIYFRKLVRLSREKILVGSDKTGALSNI